MDSSTAAARKPLVKQIIIGSGLDPWQA